MTEQQDNVIDLSPGADADDERAIFLEVQKSEDEPMWERLMGPQGVTAWNQEGGPKVVKYPLDLGVLVKAKHMGPYHRRCLTMKRMAAVGNGYTIEGDPEGKDTAKLKAVAAVLSRHTLHAFVEDRLTFDNAYLERETNVLGRTIRLHHVRANTVWKTAEGGWTQRVQKLDTDKATWLPIPAAKLLHCHGYSELSDHYGVPDYLPALLPLAVAYEADDFHRKFYQNGGHAGLLIMLRGVRNLPQKLTDELENKLKGTKGPGNFKTIFLAVKDKDVELDIKGVAKEAPVKDDYPEVNKSTREKILTAHGIPPRLASVILDAKGGGMGGVEIEDEMKLFNLSCVEPLQAELEEFLNPWLPHPIKFRPYLISRIDAASGDVVPQATAADDADDDAGAET